MPTVAIAHGFDALHLDRLTMTGWEVRDYTHWNLTALRPILSPTEGLFWPTRSLDRKRRCPRCHQNTKGDQQRTRPGYVLEPSDRGCSTLKLLAWGLTEFDGVMLGESDVRMLEKPDAWMHSQAGARLPFAATYRNLGDERGAGSDGIYSSLMWLRPNRLVQRLLSDKARWSAFVPRTNTLTDVIETAMPIKAASEWPPLPRHERGHADTLEHAAGAKDVEWEDSIRERMERMMFHFSTGEIASVIAKNAQQQPLLSVANGSSTQLRVKRTRTREGPPVDTHGWCTHGVAGGLGAQTLAQARYTSICCHRQCHACGVSGCAADKVCAKGVTGTRL